MKKIILTIFIGCIALGAKAQTTFRQPIDASECTRLFFDALVEKNVATMENVMAHDFSITSFQGREINKEFLLASISKGYLVVESGTLSGLRNRNYSDVTVVTGQWDVRTKIENANLNGVMAFMAVCVKQGGNWKVSMLQLTPVQ